MHLQSIKSETFHALQRQLKRYSQNDNMIRLSHGLNPSLQIKLISETSRKCFTSEVTLLTV